MLWAQPILDYIQIVIKHSEHVHIDERAILAFAEQVKGNDLESAEFMWQTILPQSATEGECVALPFVYNAINFCYWDEPKWTVNIDGRFYDGSVGMLYALKHAIKRGFNLLDPSYLADLSLADLKTILHGNVEIALIQERLELLRSLGQTLLEHYSGSFTEIVKRANSNAMKIVQLLATDFPAIFNDVSTYNGQIVKFYKRAQLVSAHLFDLAKFGLISIMITGYDELTAFADYKVPQLLRYFGLLKYSNELAEQIDNKVEIPSGSDIETEIRASTIWAIELTARILKKKFPQANAVKVNNLFWLKGQTKLPNDKPYHRTKTIWY